MRIAILFSGTGSNMQTLVTECNGRHGIDIGLLLSNNPNADGLAFARATGIPTVVINHRDYASRADHETAVAQALNDHKIDFICLAGYMRVLTAAFVPPWQGRMINIHPSLLPDLPGLHTHRRALEAKMPAHGCTVHLVTAEVDVGPILGQRSVPVLLGDTEAMLAARVLEAEHILYPAVLMELAQKPLV
jgi:phosphoribosylglycinamide formyltransferase-1